MGDARLEVDRWLVATLGCRDGVTTFGHITGRVGGIVVVSATILSNFENLMICYSTVK